MKKITDKTVNLKLEEIKGNTHRLHKHFAKEAKNQGWNNQEITAVLNQAQNENYDTVLTILMYCESES